MSRIANRYQWHSPILIKRMEMQSEMHLLVCIIADNYKKGNPFLKKMVKKNEMPGKEYYETRGTLYIR